MHAPDSRELRFLGALEQASTIQIVSLASREAEMVRRAHADKGTPDRGTDAWRVRNEAELDATWCGAPEACLEGNRVLGRVAVDDREGRRALIAHMHDWLAYEPQVDFNCIAEYRHAIEFVTAGKRRWLLLCYECNQFRMLEEGRQPEYPDEDSESAGRAVGHAWFAERFAAAGIPMEAPRR